MRPRIQEQERTCFQEAGNFNPRVDSQADVAIVYEINPTLDERIAHWREAGYRIHVMTGVAWGSYADYMRGEWDGLTHYEDAQTAAGDFRLEHGISQGHDNFYMMPSRAYTRYLSQKLRRVVEAGALAIHLEEPEFWIRAGYGLGFQREWAEFYGEPWQDPASSPDARYRSSKLQQHLYTRTLAFLFKEIKAYAREKEMPGFQCYVPTHSLINYAHWGIVSPESQLLTIPDCDGVIGQVWTGTSRTATVYAGIRKQRTFEAGYCEYAACAAMLRGTGKKLWQLADPIEDDPNFCWDDYRINWECTVAASLLVPDSENFEIMPWPRRIFMHSYPTVNLGTLPLGLLLEGYLKRLQAGGKEKLLAQTNRAIHSFLDFTQGSQRPGENDPSTRLSGLLFSDVWRYLDDYYKQLASWEDQGDAQRLRDALSAFYFNAAGERAAIPESYATELQIVFNALPDLSWPGETRWLYGQTGVGLAISDTLMYQRDEPAPSDADMSSLYGLAMPLVKNSTALEMVQLERVTDPGTLDHLRVILVTYEGQKPTSPQVHQALAEWVQKGNALILFGAGDAYDTVREWWNQNGRDYPRPQDHLTELLGLGIDPEAGMHPCGKGILIMEPISPASLAHETGGPKLVLSKVQRAREALGLTWSIADLLALQRGPYVVAAGMDEALSESNVSLPGMWVNLFDAELSIHTNPAIRPDTRWLLYDLSRCPQHPWVIAAAGRVEQEHYTEHSLSFTVSGMAKTQCSLRARLPSEPVSVSAGGNLAGWAWEPPSRTALVKFPNHNHGVTVEIRW